MPPKKALSRKSSDVATKRMAKTSSGRKSPEEGSGAVVVGRRKVTQKTKDKSDDEDNPMTPNTPVLDEMIRTLEREQREGDGRLKPWFETDFLLEVLRSRLNPPSERTPNPNPIFYVLIGPASSGKSSVRTR